MEFVITQVIALLGLFAVCILMLVFGFKEYKYRKKIEFLTHLVDKGYETNKVDINNL